jgi:D-lactate dehydrogenase (cytochrome)
MDLPRALDALLADMAAVVGTQALRTDEATRRLYSQDVYRAGHLAAAVVSPASTQQVAQLVRLAGAAGVDLFVRGGGMSYTDGFLPTSERSIVMDLARLNRIRDVSAADLHATVEAGCTWAALDEALAKQELRAVFWGPMSGRRATIGGGMSQGAATFGSGKHGTSASAALAFEVVLGDGQILQTAAFFRHSGPDLTGLFTGDAGAFGIKTAVTL